MKQYFRCLPTLAEPPAVLILLCLVLLFDAATCQAQPNLPDEVVLQSARASSRVTIRCEIVDYNGQLLIARTGTGRGQKEYPASEVIEVRTHRMVAHTRALEHLRQNRVTDAKAAFAEALKKEPRPWMQREIRAGSIRCALRQRDFETAAREYQLIHERDPETRHVKLIPLLWTDETAKGQAAATARLWLQDKDPVLQLIGASLLLFDKQHGRAAQDTLRLLARSPVKRIRQLAYWQEWRLRVHEGQLSALDIAQREKRIDDLAAPMRAGAWFLIGRAYLIRQEFNDAAAALLRVPIVYDSDHPVTPNACFEAAHCLERTGQRNEAALIYQEVIERFAWAPAASNAKEALQRLVATASDARDSNSSKN